MPPKCLHLEHENRTSRWEKTIEVRIPVPPAGSTMAHVSLGSTGIISSSQHSMMLQPLSNLHHHAVVTYLLLHMHSSKTLRLLAIQQATASGSTLNAEIPSGLRIATYCFLIVLAVWHLEWHKGALALYPEFSTNYWKCFYNMGKREEGSRFKDQVCLRSWKHFCGGVSIWKVRYGLHTYK